MRIRGLRVSYAHYQKRVEELVTLKQGLER